MFINLFNGVDLQSGKEEIVIWARKKTGVPVIRISSVNEAEGFLKKYHTFALGAFDKFEVHDFGLYSTFAYNINKF